MDEEKTIWEGSPSQIINLPVFVLCAVAIGGLLGAAILFRNSLTPPLRFALAGLALVPILITAWKWLLTRSRHYELTTQRLLCRQGIFSRQTDALELYRVKDYVLVEPFLLRMFGLGDIALTTSDESSQTIVLRAVPGARHLRDDLRNNVELCREKKRVRVAELE